MAAVSKSTALILLEVALFDFCETNPMIPEKGGKNLIFHNSLRDHLHAIIYMYFSVDGSLYPYSMNGYHMA